MKLDGLEVSNSCYNLLGRADLCCESPCRLQAPLSSLIVPWQKFINPVDLMICDAAEGVGEPCLRIDTVELGGFNQGIDDGRGFTAAF